MLAVFVFLISAFKIIDSPQLTQSECIWNTGIAMTSDIRPASFESVFIDIDRYLKSRQINNGDVIWLQPHCLKKFINNYLPKLSSKVILVVNTCDDSFPDCISDHKLIDALLNSHKIHHIFAQNSTLSTHPKVTQLPIGVDFHTLGFGKTSGKQAFGEGLTSSLDQQTILIGCKALQETRLMKVCSDFHLNDTTKNGGNNMHHKFGETRRDIYEKNKNNPNIDFFPDRMPRTDLWKKKAQYLFSICPIGNGMDTHRVWEDLYMEIIPIVKSTPLDPMYSMFPIVIVHDWNEITAENLEKWFIEKKDMFKSCAVKEKLTQGYWLSLINNKKLECSR